MISLDYLIDSENKEMKFIEKTLDLDRCILKGVIEKVSFYENKYNCKKYVFKVNSYSSKEEEILAYCNKFNIKYVSIIKNYYYSRLFENKYLVLNYIEGNTLYNYLKKFNSTLDFKMKLFKQLLNIVFELHNHNIVHNDLHLKNIILNKSNTIYLIDFGISFFDMTKNKIHKKKDIRSLGIILYYLLYKNNFKKLDLNDYYDKIIYNCSIDCYNIEDLIRIFNDCV